MANAQHYKQPDGAEVLAGLDAPGAGAFVVTKSDVTVFTKTPRGLWIGGAGDVYVDTLAGEVDVPFKGAQAGSVIPVRCIRVKAATTATDITAMY